MEITYTIPLGNFELEKSSVLDLGKARILDEHGMDSHLLEVILAKFRKTKDIADLDPPRFYLQMGLPDSIMENDETLRQPMDLTLTVFKLFKSFLVISNLVFITDQSDTKAHVWRHYVHWISRVRKPPIYSLSQSEEQRFREFWNEFRSINSRNFAVYRFHLADIRPYLRDRFSDYVESMEYLLVPDSGQGEIAYKFRTRGALVIGTDGNRQQVYRDLDDSYDLRSAIVHGISERENKILRKKAVDEVEALEEMIRLARDYDRRLIVLFFRSGCYDDRDKRTKYVMQRALCT
jgi:hypothetical protein